MRRLLDVSGWQVLAALWSEQIPLNKNMIITCFDRNIAKPDDTVESDVTIKQGCSR